MAAAERAVELDDISAEAHTSLAASKENDWDWGVRKANIDERLS